MPSDPVIERFQSLLRIATVSRRDRSEEDRTEFERFQQLLVESYPLIHSQLEREVVNGGALLYRWPGGGVGAPSVLMAHYDVVPADEPGWQHPPFAATLTGDGDEARIWGRGAIDDKGALGSLLEAVEARLADGYVPAADVYLVFDDCEETDGAGAEAIVEVLFERGIRPGFVLDEGGAVVENIFPGVSGQLAVVGVTEKGIAGVELVVEKPGGHASTPARDGATARLARAITRLEEHPSKAFLSPPNIAMLEALGSRASGARGSMLRRAGKFETLLVRMLGALTPETSAMVRTTRAVTRLSGSAADNVIAERATAMINVRIAVGSTVDEAVDDIRRAIDDPVVQVHLRYGFDPSPVSPSSGPAWDTLAESIAAVFPGALLTPYVMLQASDSRFFARISENVYRFLPFDLSRDERAALHAIDESIRVGTYRRAIRFFDDLIGRI
jgi:carboxypeptidase PM20D1